MHSIIVHLFTIFKLATAWVSAVLSTRPQLYCIEYTQFSKNAQNIRNPIPFWCKINSPQKNRTKQKEGGFPVVNFTSNTYQMKREILSWIIHGCVVEVAESHMVTVF